ncbi:WapI family immunity protein [Planococcus alpniumensis]|uniref:WapI family immunity protein n=1 Tax=Planococcus alpniumensis TaxID=2708345 RepID=UPI001B8C8727|nr:hypothetical protein [Planococcus sp. MSAK28401]
MKVHILGEQAETQIEVLKRSYPKSVDFWDANWLDTMIIIKIPGYSAHFDAQLRADEFRDFHKQLKEMNKRLKRKVELTSMEGVIDVQGRINLLGRIVWKVETQYPVGTGAVLTFEFDSDQSFVPPLLKELEGVLTNYPVIGTP